MASADFTRIASNIGALNALYSLRKTNTALGLHQTRLATGKRINSAADDPAGLSIATKMNARSEGLKVALDNIGDAQNMLSVGESGLSKINDILVQMRTKAEAAATDTLGDAERTAIKSQLDSWALEVNGIVDTTQWNGKKLLDGLGGYSASTVTFQVGADTDAANQVTLVGGSGGAFAGVSTQSLLIGSDANEVANWTGASFAKTAGQTAVASFTGLGELATGSYTLVVTSTSSVAGTIQLKNAAGAVEWIDDNGTYQAGGDTLTQTRALTLVAGALANIDTGRGLKFDLTGLAATDNFTITFDYNQEGVFNGAVSSAQLARDAMDALDDAIATVSTRLGTLGALGGRLSFREEALSVAQVNTEAAYNRIMNADFAFEQVEVTKLAILSQTSMAMLGQANQAPQGVLSLFR